MKIIYTPWFKKAIKRLQVNQKNDLDNAIAFLIEEPLIGELKVGDLAGTRVHKFKMNNQLTLLAYIYCDEQIILTLLDLGSHQNFYRDLKKKL
ncbi:MAG: type II toxin-antitoxin system RelE/ParE family toxin [Cyanobacteria bacterium]|nr:type II toxin-antitoxin system RelE/ParE family toxin [Cyanobacteriota bacterium]MDA1020709.1 type II toxin-antitoxin system RelE/ParE family toxin [Cyanobacteriota bacterium]